MQRIKNKRRPHFRLPKGERPGRVLTFIFILFNFISKISNGQTNGSATTFLFPNTGQPKGIAHTFLCFPIQGNHKGLPLQFYVSQYRTTTRVAPTILCFPIQGNHRGCPYNFMFPNTGQPQGLPLQFYVSQYRATTRDCPYQFSFSNSQIPKFVILSNQCHTPYSFCSAAFA